MYTNLTPYMGLTDDELLREVMNQKEPTALEVELMLRVERLRDEVADLKDINSVTTVNKKRWAA